MDSSIYDVVFSDGEVLEYSANIIAENLYSQVDDEGHHQVMIDNIMNHKKDSTAVPIKDGTLNTKVRLARGLLLMGGSSVSRGRMAPLRMNDFQTSRKHI